MKIKLVITDIDGTLIDESETIPQEFVEMVERCKAAGIIFSLATGRTKELVGTVADRLHITDPYVIANGACIFRGEECLQSHSFSALPVLDFIRKADEMGLTVTLADERTERALRPTDYVLEHQKKGNRFKTFLNPDTTDWENERFQKIMFMDEHKTGKIREFQEKLQDFGAYYWVTAYSDAAVELGPKNCNKATGLKDLVKLLGIKMEEVMACGDFDNDLQMIQEAGIGVAVGNANDVLKKHADYVAKASYALGVKEAVEHYCF